MRKSRKTILWAGVAVSALLTVAVTAVWSYFCGYNRAFTTGFVDLNEYSFELEHAAPEVFMAERFPDGIYLGRVETAAQANIAAYRAWKRPYGMWPWSNRPYAVQRGLSLEEPKETVWHVCCKDMRVALEKAFLPYIASLDNAEYHILIRGSDGKVLAMWQGYVKIDW